MTPSLWAVQTPDGRIDHELVGPRREVDWWCSTDEGRAAGRRPVTLHVLPKGLALKLRRAVEGVMAHQWSHNSIAMHALTQLVDAANATADAIDSEVAQSVEPGFHSPQVGGSIPPLATNEEPV